MASVWPSGNLARAAPCTTTTRVFISLVLMALVDADYKFLWVDISAYGSMSDAQIFNLSELKDCLEYGTIGFPEPSLIPKDDEPMAYFILGDDAFGIRTF